MSRTHRSAHRMSRSGSERWSWRHSKSGCTERLSGWCKMWISSRSSDKRWSRWTRTSERRSASWRWTKRTWTWSIIRRTATILWRWKSGISNRLRSGTRSRRGRTWRCWWCCILRCRWTGLWCLILWSTCWRTCPRRRALERWRPLEARRRPGKRIRRVWSKVLGLRAGRRSLPGSGGVLQGDWQRDGRRDAAAKTYNLKTTR